MSTYTLVTEFSDGDRIETEFDTFDAAKNQLLDSVADYLGVIGGDPFSPNIVWDQIQRLDHQTWVWSDEIGDAWGLRLTIEGEDDQ